MLKKYLHILVTSLNSGDKLFTTLESIFSQGIDNLRVIIKDGGSTDGSLQRLIDAGYFTSHPECVLKVCKDESIYDGMNQAIEVMQQQIDERDINYCMFLNCGDTFYGDHVLSEVMPHLISEEKPCIIYGDLYNRLQRTVVSSSPRIDEFTLYRNVPCHQVCFYDTRLFDDRGYEIKYTVRADYEHFLYCVYEANCNCKHIDVIICDYEGGGYSETRENRKLSAKQHREITDRYMQRRARRYRWVMICTLAPLRTKLSQSPTFSKVYNSLKSKLYSRCKV